MELLNSRGMLAFLLAVIIASGFMYYTRPEHQSTPLGKALQRFAANTKAPSHIPNLKKADIDTRSIDEKLNDLLK